MLKGRKKRDYLKEHRAAISKMSTSLHENKHVIQRFGREALFHDAWSQFATILLQITLLKSQFITMLDIIMHYVACYILVKVVWSL